MGGFVAGQQRVAAARNEESDADAEARQLWRGTGKDK
eukprot:SAG25_NODE_4510_length_800_cov_6.383738_1_plen_37_part_00